MNVLCHNRANKCISVDNNQRTMQKTNQLTKTYSGFAVS